jgi:hypothetical protein
VKLLLLVRYIRGKDLQMNQDIIDEFHYYQFGGKMFSGILAGRVRDWLVNHEVLSTFQAGFVRGKRALDNVFIIKTIVDKYLRKKKRPNVLELCGLRENLRFN